MQTAYFSSYPMHLHSKKMYHDLKAGYWWEGMKRDITNFVSQCLTCQQVKVEHQSPTSLHQNLEIVEWKWEKITMDFVTRLPKTSKCYDSI